MTIRPVLAAMTATMLLVGPATAQEARFTMQQTDNGYLRMDNQTGQISICMVEDDQVVCKMAADERAAYDADLAALEDRIIALERRLGTGDTLAGEALPSEEEFEKTLSYMERFMRRFKDIVDDFSEEPLPDRT